VKDTVGYMLREAWKQKGEPGCRHPKREIERSFSGTVTGCHVCTTCGHLLRMSLTSAGRR